MSKINILKLAEDTNELTEQFYSFGHKKNTLLTKKQEFCHFNKEKRESDSKRSSKKISISKKIHQCKAAKQLSLRKISDETDAELKFLADRRFGLKEKEVTCVEALSYINF